MDLERTALLALGALGAITLARVVLSVLSFLYVHFLRPGKNLKKLGSWAVVTGSTDGIGKELAKQLAKKGINVVIVGRTPSKLADAKKEIKEKAPNVEVKEVQFDFSSASQADYARLEKEIGSLEVGILYNNVGVSYDHAEVLLDITDEKIDSLIEVNNRSMVKVTRMVLPGMLSRKKGAIINVGSFVGTVTDPFYAVYSGSKGFVTMFSKSLSVELKGTGVTVSDHNPLVVATKMSIPNEKRRKGSMMIPWPAQWAASSLKHVGYESYIQPYWAHALQAAAATGLPSWAWDRIRYGMNAKIRKIALKKKQQ
mmetsp:Transcript_16387/g.39976  ORF Transcript_16387/g.39976 Transcript_16387/m.39976 type:complete len:312 (+) Transcript_16387:34-969(+)|eukprot:CAMPEP_0206232014 /NCGR_PEP_ID=MMETSP0047_2-20121206/11172_1 /ASSEMBLY_ACC=CAM_ASM_000192 /TAXON_ID=195065 /ORGANISM="Chroomonas mesostigmatica_cf, Strain CCMP1168" /LENGTH=311 /DNA_ID=CAMNT_0053655687 /DNA_START=23 /DNA_END=958 /DNA_ORIENTATION=+